MAPKEIGRTYEATRDVTYAAAARAVARVGMKTKESDPQRGMIAATTGVTIWSWGERVEVSVAELGPASTSVTVAIALRFQVFGWGQQQRVASGLLDEVGRQLVHPHHLFHRLPRPCRHPRGDHRDARGAPVT